MESYLEVEHLPWSIKRDPGLPSIPTFKHPKRCLNCGHHEEDHDSSVGCLVEGGTKYVENAEGVGKRVCSCVAFVAVPESQLIHEADTNAIHATETEKLQETNK